MSRTRYWRAALLAVLFSTLAAVPLRAQVVVSEMMYNPLGGSTEEFIELYNAGEAPVDIGGWAFTAGISYTFASPTVLEPGAYLVVAVNRTAFLALYPEVSNLAPGVYGGQLSNDGETVTLSDGSGQTMFSVTYNDKAPWPLAADGLGSSLVLLDPFAPPSDPANWAASARLHGSPGGPDSVFVSDVVINEILAHTDPPFEDAIELRNLTTNAVSLAGWYLSDDNAVRKKYRFPEGTVIPPLGYVVVYEAQLNAGAVPFSLSSKGGEGVYLSEADEADKLIRYVDQYAFDASQNGFSFGRWPDGTGPFVTLATPTFGVAAPASLEAFRTGTGARNSGPKVGPVVINEIMYHPPDTNALGRMAAEYIELLNISDAPVPFYNLQTPTNTWALTGGVSYSFPEGVVMQPGAFLIVTSTNDLDGFRASYGIPSDVVILGPWSKALGNSGDTVRLRAPNNLELPDNTVARYVVDEVTYDDQLPWPLAADGLGGALERTDPAAYGNTPSNWHSSPGVATPGAPNSAFLPPGSVIISEVMAVNRTTLRDEDGDFSDWIELHNTTFQTLSLKGWHLTDRAGTPDLWTFPDVSITPYGQLVVFASSKNRANKDGELHTNFSLDAGGEYLALFRADLTQEFAFDPGFPPQVADVSYGADAVGTRVEVPVRAGTPGRYLVPTNAAALDAAWNTAAFDDGAWKPAGNGIGYDTDPNYLPFIQTDLYAEMYGKQGSAFVRYPFVLDDAARVTQLLLRLRFEDGVAVWLNGVKVASDNAPSSPVWDSRASSSRNEALAVANTDFTLDAFTHLLVDGTNVLALQVLNNSTTSSDLLLVSELRLTWAPAVTRKTPVESGTPGRYLVPTNAAALDAVWNTVAFDDGAWKPAGNGVGYDTDPDYLPFIQTDLYAEMYGKQGSAFVRYPFILHDSADIFEAVLRVRFEDGFAAWLNGTPIASSNVPSPLVWNSRAPSNRSESLAVAFTEYSLNDRLPLLVEGTNVLALQVLNSSSTSSDLLLMSELAFAWRPPTSSVEHVFGYLAASSPGSLNAAAFDGVAPAPQLSHPGGVFVGTLSLAVTCAHPGAAVRYTLDGSVPTAASPLYEGPLLIDDETEVLVRAFVPGLVASPVVGAVYRRTFLGINEFMASNVTATPEIADFTDFGDWVELYNGGADDVDLSGYHLSDNLESPFRWRIPDGAVIPAGGHLLIWADGYDARPGLTLKRDFWPNYTFVTRSYHANFKLSSDGEQIGLFTPGGSLVDGVTFGAQQDDISCGRLPDGGATWGYFGESTAGTANRGPQLSHNRHRAPAVTVSPAEPLFVDGPVTVTLTAGDGVSAIRYTLDSSQPTSSSLLYSGAFSVTTNTVVRARAYADGVHPGPVVTRTFLVNQRKPDLPVVSLVIDPQLLFDPVTGIYSNVLKGRDVPGAIQFCVTPSNTAFHVGAAFRLYSLNTFLKPQKPLTVKISGKYGADEIDYQLFPEKPVGPFDRFVLRNGNDDWASAFLRDTLGQRMLMGAINNAVQGFRPCASYLNGSYYGLINIQEKMDEMYCVKNYGVALDDIDFFENAGTSSDDLLNHGTADGWNALLAFLGANNMADPANYEYVKGQVDIEDLVDYVSGQVFASDTAWAHNRKWWRDRNPGGKWRWCFVDLDRAFGNVSDNRLASMVSGMVVFRELLANTDFRAYCSQRMMAHLNSSFSTNRILPIIDYEAGRIRSEIIEHAALYASQGGIPSVTTWDTRIEAIRTFARQRPAIAMQHVADYFAGGQTAQIQVAGPGGGSVLANHVPLRNSSTNTLLSGVPVTFTAVPEIGQAFAHWVVTRDSQQNVVNAGSDWRYHVPAATVPGWETPAFDDSAWASGPAQLGYGDGDEATVIGTSADQITAAYFRRTVVITNAASVSALSMQILHDDGVIVYLNGTEIVRANMPSGPVDFTTLALTNITSTSTPNENAYNPYTVASVPFVEGTNVLAVAIHQSAANFTDLGFDLAAAVTQTSGSVETNTSSVLTLVPDSATPLNVTAVFVPTGASLLPASVSGSLALTAAGSPWLATGDIYVPSNTVLTAEPGVEILMPERASIYVHGRLCLAGTPDAPVRVGPNTNLSAIARLYTDPALADATDKAYRWGGIVFDRADHEGVLSNVVIRGATLAANDCINMKAAVSAFGSDLFMWGLDIAGSDFPIFVQEGHSTVLENSRIFIDVVGDGINIKRAAYARVEGCEFSSANLTADTDAIDYDGIQGGVIRNNHIHDFMGDNNDAIDIGEGTLDLLVEGNLIERCYDKAVSIGQASTAVVRRNVIRDVGMGLGIKDTGSYGLIEHNTFRDVTHAVAVYEKNLGKGGGAADVRNCIVSHAKDAPFTCDALSSLSVSHTLCDTEAVPGTGNRFAEPQFLRPSQGNFALQTGSAAIDSGDPASERDPDGTRADMGAVPFDWREGHAVISEIHYNPAAAGEAEYIELTNPGGAALDLSGYSFSKGLTFTFPDGTLLQPGAYLVVASSPATPNNAPALVWTAGALDNAGETIELIDVVSNEIDRVSYKPAAPWPATPDGGGVSLALIHPRWDNALPESWYASAAPGGTPGGPFDNPEVMPVHRITVAAAGRGTVTPAGEVTVPAYSSPSFTLTPAAWCFVQAVEVDGVPVGAPEQYTFGNVLADHTLLAVFGEELTARGTPKWWLAENGAAGDFDAAAEADDDGDGMPNWAEYVAGTQPTNAASVFQMEATAAADGALVVRCKTVPADMGQGGRQRYYSLEGRESLSAQAWSAVEGYTDILGLGQTIIYTNRSASGAGFIRAKTNLR